MIPLPAVDLTAVGRDDHQMRRSETATVCRETRITTPCCLSDPDKALVSAAVATYNG